jgi:hypothetical protein
VLAIWCSFAWAGDGDVTLAIEEGRVAVERGMYGEARERALQALAAEPDRAGAIWLYIETMLRAGMGPQGVWEVNDRAPGTDPWTTDGLARHLAEQDWGAVRGDVAEAPFPDALEPLWAATEPAAQKQRDRALSKLTSSSAMAEADTAWLLALRRAVMTHGLEGRERIEPVLLRRGVLLPPARPPLSAVERATLARALADQPEPVLPAASPEELVALALQLEPLLQRARRFDVLAAVWTEVQVRTGAAEAFVHEATAWLDAGDVVRAAEAVDRTFVAAAAPLFYDLACTNAGRLRSDLAAALLVRARLAEEQGDVVRALGDYGAAVLLAEKVLDAPLAERLERAALPDVQALTARYAGPVPAEVALQVAPRAADPTDVTTRAAHARFLATSGTRGGLTISRAAELYAPVFAGSFALEAEAAPSEANARTDMVIATLLAGRDRPFWWAKRGELHRALDESEAAFHAFAQARGMGVRGLEDELAATYRGPRDWESVADQFGGEPPSVPAVEKAAPRPPAPRRPNAASNSGPELSRPFPNFEIRTNYGTFGARSLIGHTTVLVLWDSGCGDCLQMLYAFGSLGRRLRADGRDVNVVGIDLDPDVSTFEPIRARSVEKVEMFWAPELRRSLAVSALPTVWIVDPSGVARAFFDHWLSAGDLEAAIAEIE